MFRRRRIVRLYARLRSTISWLVSISSCGEKLIFWFGMLSLLSMLHESLRQRFKSIMMAKIWSVIYPSRKYARAHRGRIYIFFIITQLGFTHTAKIRRFFSLLTCFCLSAVEVRTPKRPDMVYFRWAYDNHACLRHRKHAATGTFACMHAST